MVRAVKSTSIAKRSLSIKRNRPAGLGLLAGGGDRRRRNTIRNFTEVFMQHVVIEINTHARLSLARG
jgi:hypothetical protein